MFNMLSWRFAGVRYNSQAQFREFGIRLQSQQDKFDATIVGIKPVLDCIDLEPAEPAVFLPGDRPPTPRDLMQLWIGARRRGDFTRSAASYAVVHALSVVQSHYPSVSLGVIDTGFARGTSASRITELDDEAEDSAIKLTDDLDLFGEGSNNA